MTRRAWTEEEDARLRREYPVTTDTDALARRMRRSRASVQVRAYHLGLAKTGDVRREINSINLSDEDEFVPRLEVIHAPEPGIVRIVRHRCR
jgi:hypothetical protein